MALAITPLLKWALQPSEFIAIIKVVGDSSYPAGGYPITPSMFTLNTFASTSDFQLQAPTNASGYYIGADLFESGTAGAYSTIDDTNGKLRFFAATGTEIGTGSSAAGQGATLIAFGH
jgi:hypothetical protein